MSTYAVLRTVKFSTKEEPFEIGDQITLKEFCTELPELRKRERIIAQLINMRKIVEISDKKPVDKKSQSVTNVTSTVTDNVTSTVTNGKSDGVTYLGGAYFQLPDGTKVRGKEKAEKLYKEKQW